MQKRTVTPWFCCMLQLYIYALLHQSKKNKAHWHTEHVVFLLVHFFGKPRATIQTKRIGTALFSTCISFISCLASPKQPKQNAQAQKTKSMQCFVYMFFF